MGAGGSLLSNRTRSHSYSTASGYPMNAGSTYSLLPYDNFAAGHRKFSHANPLQTLPTQSGVAAAASTTMLTLNAAAAGADSSSSRRDSSCTAVTNDCPVLPWIFKNALHAAIQHGAIDVLAEMLACGVDPNRTGTGTGNSTAAATVDAAAVAVTDTALPADSSAVGGRVSRDVRFCLSVDDNSANNGKLSSSSEQCVKQSQAEPSLSAPCPTSKASVSPRTNLVSKPSLTAVDIAGQSGMAMSEGGGLYTVEYLYSLPPLFLAVVNRNAPAVRLLLAYGASPDVEDAVGRTCVQLAASAEFQSWPCAISLIEHGAKIWSCVGGDSSKCSGSHRGPSAVDLCPELAEHQASALRDRLAVVISYCSNHPEMVARRTDLEARQAAAASAAVRANLEANCASNDQHFRGFDAATRFFRRSNQQHTGSGSKHAGESVKRRVRRDSSGTIGARRSTAAAASAASWAEPSVIEVDGESTTGIEGCSSFGGNVGMGMATRDEYSASSTHSVSGRLSFSFRPTLASVLPSQYDDIGIEISTSSCIEAEKVYLFSCLQFITRKRPELGILNRSNV